MKKIIIIGAGGNSKVIIDIILNRVKLLDEKLEILGILDDDPDKKLLNDYPVIGSISDFQYGKDNNIHYINGIGNNMIRKKIYEKLDYLSYYTAIHPSAILGSGVSIGAGSIIMPGAIINSGSQIGKQTLINTGAIIEHDNVIDDFVHIASGVTTAGNVKVGETTMLGTGTKVIQGINIGSYSMVGAGAVVIKDIPDYCTAVGVPAKVIKTDHV